jgi:hypothetical protein
VALSSGSVVEMVTLRADVASPMRTIGSFVMRTASGSTSGVGKGAAVSVGHEEVVARRGLVAGCCSCASCAMTAREDATRAQQSRVATSNLLKEERIGLFRLTDGVEVKGGERAFGDSTIDAS